MAESSAPKIRIVEPWQLCPDLRSGWRCEGQYLKPTPPTDHIPFRRRQATGRPTRFLLGITSSWESYVVDRFS